MKKSRPRKFARNSQCQHAHAVGHHPSKPEGLVTLNYTNDGADIVMSKTTYWDSLLADAGKPFATWSEGVLRILLPRNLQSSIGAMQDAYQVIVSRGPHPDLDLQDCFEILFENGKEESMTMHFSASFVHLMPKADDVPAVFLCTVWGPEGKVCSLPARFREAKSLPLLTPWTSAKLLPNDGELRDFLEDMFRGQFESHVFPYLHKFALKSTRGAIGRTDWQYKRVADGIVVVTPKSVESITTYGFDGAAHTLSPEAFGMICFVVTCDPFIPHQKVLKANKVWQHFKALIRHMQTHPERLQMVPLEQ